MMTGFPCEMQAFTARRWITGRSSKGHSMPRSPRATIRASQARTISSRLVIADWSSIFAITRAWDFFEARNSVSCATSAASLTKESARKSIPTAESARSFSVKAGRLTLTPGRLMWRLDLSSPGISTRQRMCASRLASTSSLMRPLSTSTVSPTFMSVTSPV